MNHYTRICNIVNKLMLLHYSGFYFSYLLHPSVGVVKSSTTQILQDRSLQNQTQRLLVCIVRNVICGISLPFQLRNLGLL